ncbi:MAG: exosortase/archaeosortase family protein [Opitutaceae bacterium]
MTTPTDKGTGQEPVIPIRSGPGRLAIMLLVLSAVIVWMNWAFQLSIFWDAKSYYNYGWVVPVLALFLIWRRLGDRPTPVPPSVLDCVFVVGAFLILPFVQLFTEAIPNWRMIAWIHTGTVIFLSLGIAILMGGRRFGAHLFFPIAFLVTALPWPQRYEIPIISGLTDGVVHFTVECLRFFAVPAIYTGNVIEVGSQTVMVGDVCSGIRSLQALVMVGLFFGELFRHGIGKRLLLVFTAGFFAFAFNCFRALTLTLVVLYGEPGMFDAWHDWVGALAFGGSCLGLFLVSEWLNRGEKTTGGGAQSQKSFWDFNPIRPAFARLALSWIVLSFVLIEWWFARHDQDAPVGESLIMNWPDPSAESGFQFLDVPNNVQEFLRYDHGQRAEFYLPDGSRIEIYFLTWDRGILGMEAVDNHSPDICMVRNGGAVVEARTAPKEFDLLSSQIPFDTYQMRYPQIDQSFQTFRAVWLRGSESELNDVVSFRTRNQSITDHFRGAVERIRVGRRNFPVAMLLIGIEGKANIDDAWSAVEKILHSALVIEDVETEDLKP